MKFKKTTLVSLASVAVLGLAQQVALADTEQATILNSTEHQDVTKAVEKAQKDLDVAGKKVNDAKLATDYAQTDIDDIEKLLENPTLTDAERAQLDKDAQAAQVAKKAADMNLEQAQADADKLNEPLQKADQELAANLDKARMIAEAKNSNIAKDYFDVKEAIKNSTEILKEAEGTPEYDQIKETLKQLEDKLPQLEAKASFKQDDKEKVKAELAEVRETRKEAAKNLADTKKKRDEIRADYKLALSSLSEAQAEYEMLDPRSKEAMDLRKEMDDLLTELQKYHALLDNAEEEILEAQLEHDQVCDYIMKLESYLGLPHSHDCDVEMPPVSGAPASMPMNEHPNPEPGMLGMPGNSGNHMQPAKKEEAKTLPNTGTASSSLGLIGLVGLMTSLLGVGYVGRHSRKK